MDAKNEKKDTKSHKFALDHKRAELFMIPPRTLKKEREDGLKGGLIIIGLDTPHVAGEHELWRADVKSPAKEYLVNSIRKHGVLSPIRARKMKGDFEQAEVIVGRDRVKACRVLEDEGLPILVPTLLWPPGTPLAEIIGAANAENYARKTESLIAQAQHVFLQLQAEGYGNGRDEEAMHAVHASTGISVQRIKTMMEFRGEDDLVRAVKLYEEGKNGGIQGEAALAIASLPTEERAEEFKKALANPHVTVSMVRESVSRAKRASKAKRSGKKVEDVAFSLSKRDMSKLAQDQSDKAEADVDDIVIKTLRVCAGEAPPSTIKGMTKAMRAVGLLKE